MAAAVDVGQRGDRVAGGDHLRHRGRRARRRLDHPAGVDGDPADVALSVAAARAASAAALRLERGSRALRACSFDAALARAQPAPGSAGGAAPPGARRRCCAAPRTCAVSVGRAARAGASKRGLAGHGLARGAGPGDDVGILRRDPVHEVDPLEQLVEAVRLEDHRDQVGLALLVVRHQVLASAWVARSSWFSRSTRWLRAASSRPCTCGAGPREPSAGSGAAARRWLASARP